MFNFYEINNFFKLQKKKYFVLRCKIQSNLNLTSKFAIVKWEIIYVFPLYRKYRISKVHAVTEFP